MGDSVAEGQGLPADENSLHDRIIEKLQSKLRSKKGTPFCYPEPSIYHKSSTLIPAWYQSSPQIASAELPKSGAVNVDWMRNSEVGPGGRSANLQLLKGKDGNVLDRGTMLTFSGTFSSFDLDYYTSAWGLKMEVSVDGKVVTTADTFEQLGAWQYGPRKYTWGGGSNPAPHTVKVTAIKDPRFYNGSVIVGGFTPYDNDRGRCPKVLDLSHGGFGVHFAETLAPQTIRDDVRSGSGSRGLDLMVLAYGYNDPAYYTPSEYAQAYQNYIDLTRSYGYSGPIVLVGMPTPSISTGWKVQDWKPYLDAIKSLATFRNRATYIGLDGVMPAQPNGGIWSDTVHLNAKGTELVAGYLSDYLTGTKFSGSSYEALGDSYSAGVGTDYKSSDPCYRSPFGYAPLIASAHSLTLGYRACSGNTTAQITSDQLGSLTGSTDYVTMTAGGNDIHFSDVIEKCFFAIDDSDCTKSINSEQGALDSMPSTYDSLYGKIAAKAPHAHVTVGGYPHLFTRTCIATGAISDANASLINGKIDTLNGYIRDTANKYGFSFVDPVPSFENHGACASNEWINAASVNDVSLHGVDSKDSFHPNKAGNVAYQGLFEAAMGLESPRFAARVPSVSGVDGRVLTDDEVRDMTSLFRSVGAGTGRYEMSMLAAGWPSDQVQTFQHNISSGDIALERQALVWFHETAQAHQS